MYSSLFLLCAYFRLCFFNSIFSSQINFSPRWLNQRSREWRTFKRWVKQRNSLLHLPIRKVDRKEPRWSSRLSDKLTRMPPDSMPPRLQRWRWMRLLRQTEKPVRVMKTGKRLWTNDRTRSKKPIPMHQWQLRLSLDRRSLRIWKLMESTHTSLSEAMTHDRSQSFVKMPLRNRLQCSSKGLPVNHWHILTGRRKKSNLPPFKLEFEAQQKPMEIQVLNDLVKHNGRLNVNTASYSINPQSRHVLLVFANDAPTYEILFESSSWPTSICGLPFKVTLASRIPTSYSVLVKRVPREWHVDSIRPLIAQRYLSNVQVARISRGGQLTNRIRVDSRSHGDLQKILQCSHISIDNIRYPAVAYKPLARIDRCFRCQQFGHKAANCSNERKRFKCGENHQYNPDCANVFECANCNTRHMADSPECPVKISYLREKRN